MLNYPYFVYYISIIFIHHSIDSVVAYFHTAGIWDKTTLSQRDSDVIVAFGSDIQSLNLSARWQIHELPVDITIDPKFRCKSAFIGPMKHTGGDREYIYNVTVTSLVMNSIVLIVNDSLVTCATTYLESGSYIPVTVDFRSGVFGRMYVIEWPGEQTTSVQVKMLS